jgi:DNA-binding HxlR family transcriptional regulator
LEGERGRSTLPRMNSGFGQFRPIAVACEIFAERWTPMILRELLAASARFTVDIELDAEAIDMPIR